MPQLILGGSRPRRAALVLAYILLASLTVVALVDVGRLLSPPAVPAMGGAAAEPPPPASLPASLLAQWLDLTGSSGLRVLLGLAIPGMPRPAPATPAGAAAPRAGGLVAYLLDALTSVKLDEPATLLVAQIRGMRSVRPASRGAVTIMPDSPGEGESATPPALSDRPPIADGGAGTPSGAGQDPPALGDPRGGDWDPAHPLIAVYHSHARESYLPLVKRVSTAECAKIDAEEAFANEPELTVVRVGQELSEVLAQEYGLPTVHSRRFHDAGGRLGAYVESAQTIERLLAQYPSLRVLLDVHRDSPRRARTTAVVNGNSVARILLVVGTDVKLRHPGWQDNYDFALRLHGAMERLYPGLSLGVLVKESRYNQHFLPHATLVEVGGVDNTLQEVLTSARLFARALVAVLAAEPGLIPREGHVNLR